jgi:hypothetical protein
VVAGEVANLTFYAALSWPSPGVQKVATDRQREREGNEAFRLFTAMSAQSLSHYAAQRCHSEAYELPHQIVRRPEGPKAGS